MRKEFCVSTLSKALIRQMELTRDKGGLGIGNVTKQKYLDADDVDWRPEGKPESVVLFRNAVKWINDITQRQAGEKITIKSILEVSFSGS